jgi:hypothetical protein
MAFSSTGAASGALGGAAAGTSILPGWGTAAGALIGGVMGSGMLGGGSNTASAPSFNPQQALALEQQQYNQMANQAQGYASNLYNQAAQQGIDFSNQGTAQNIRLQNKVTPGSSAQREQALQQINSYIQGQVPQDVQQNINRQVAQNLGGGFNLFSGGGQAPQNFARNIGQTSLGLSQFGLSAAPTWQQLANTMVVSPQVGLAAGLQAGSIGTQLAGYAAGQGNQLAESQYQGAFNQYQGQQLQNQMQNQMGLGLGQLGLQGYSAMNKANYLNSLGGQNINESNISGMLPSASGAQATMSQLGYPNAGSGFTALPNTGAGTPYPFMQ